MIKIIDRFDGKVIQKVTKPSGELLRYQVVEPGNGASCHEFKTLTEARSFYDCKAPPPVILTKPKAANPQNQPGYRATKK